MSATIQGAPPAGMRAVVRVPLSFGDGYTVEADVYTFTGLVDGREHLALGLGDHRGAEVPLVRPHNLRYLEAKIAHTGHILDLPLAG